MPDEVITDEERIKQVLINLIQNAFKFTLAGGSITIQLSYDVDHDFIIFRVMDTGIGIKQEDKDKLFKLFGKLEAT